jgi:hypothetical protein
MTIKGEISDAIGPYEEMEISDREAHMINRDIIERTSFLKKLETDTSGAENKIKLLHKIAVVGVTNEDGEKINGGKYRTEGVGFGDKFIAPEFTDVPDLMIAFTSKIEMLSVDIESEEDVNLLATWSYLTLNRIHPFEDGNGRTSRSLVEYTRYVRCKKIGVEYEPLRFPSTDEFDKETISLINTYYDNNFEPEVMLGLENLDDVSIFYRELSKGNKLGEYYAQLRQNLLNNIENTTSIRDLKSDTTAVGLAKKLSNVDHWSTGFETKSLKGLEIIERAKEILV